ncbi:hypothetical protein M422DRAFT_248038 [Sphaerobolus stellatus SS14]|uniref:Uncharacterized protein n=1 Tax=Sphaerobolus stellatus (strain SS14) TaxID=990650 RepID=A0A0C9UIN8_SPHS4|nr:hypothetical protein M422DRAFT_273957 [Sphaerobolus stellatus SS14]KIJ48240.1 hypothetical protein M422DRAFT_248038 [Sphaerobolus stellatus SS14]
MSYYAPPMLPHDVPSESFKDWNADSQIAKTVNELYGGDINNLELCPGLHDGDRLRYKLLFDAGGPILHNGVEWQYNLDLRKNVERDFNNSSFGGHIYKFLMQT